jgi:hypothetical protein
MARSVDQEINDLLQSGQVTEVVDNKFGKAVRNVDQDPMDVGDQFEIKAGFKILQAPIVKGGDPQKFILVPVTNKNTGIVRNIRIFPNMFAKILYPIVNGQRQAKVKTVGSAALEYQKFADAGVDGQDLAMAALAAKCAQGFVIEVTAKTPYRVLKYQSTEETDTSLFTYDFVQKAA